jgi:hypothetical protein
MNVIVNSADGDAAATNVLDDSADVRPAFRRQIAIEVRKPIFGAEDEVSEERGESMAHRTTSIVEMVIEFRDFAAPRLDLVGCVFPRLTPWAT